MPEVEPVRSKTGARLVTDREFVGHGQRPACGRVITAAAWSDTEERDRVVVEEAPFL
jgi:hypothetical protein